MCSEEMISTISDVVKSYIGFRPRGCFLMGFTHDRETGKARTDKQASEHLKQWCDRQIEELREEENYEREQKWLSKCRDLIANGNAIPGIHYPGSGRQWELVTE